MLNCKNRPHHLPTESLQTPLTHKTLTLPLLQADFTLTLPRPAKHPFAGPCHAGNSDSAKRQAPSAKHPFPDPFHSDSASERQAPFCRPMSRRKF